MALSELDPITHYFACFNNKAVEERDSPFKPKTTRTLLDEKAERLQNPGTEKHTTEESNEALLSKNLEDLRSLLTPEEELKILKGH